MSKYCIQLEWADAPHLPPAVQRELLASIPPYQREARSKGIPSLGSGAIYPVPDAELIVSDFPIPPHWKRAYGFDVGWNKTAAVWGAINPDTDVLYIYAEYYRGKEEPAVHTAGIQSRGKWIPGAIDPASRNRSQKDGEQLLELYNKQGLILEMADNAVSSGLYEVWHRMSTQRLKVFASCVDWYNEKRTYCRDEKGAVVKLRDHLMDATRYLVMTGIEIAITEPSNVKNELYKSQALESATWMGR